MTVKSQIQAVNMMDYLRAGRLNGLIDAFRSDEFFERLKSGADSVWSSREHITLTFAYDTHSVHVSFSRSGEYLFDSVDFEAGPVLLESADSLFPDAPEDMEKLRTAGLFDAERFDLQDEIVYLLSNAATVHYAINQKEARLCKIAGTCLSLRETHRYLKRLSESSIV